MTAPLDENPNQYTYTGLNQRSQFSGPNPLVNRAVRVRIALCPKTRKTRPYQHWHIYTI